MKNNPKDIPLLDCPMDYLFGDATGKIMNEYGRFPCKIKCAVYALLVKGSAKATINITQYEFKENDALILEPGSFMLIHECSNDALVYYVLFSSAFLEKNDNSASTMTSLQVHSPIAHIPVAHADVYKSFYSVMLQAANSKPSMLNSEIMVPVFHVLRTSYENFVKQEENNDTHTKNRSMQIYQEYSQLVLKHYKEWHLVSQYAKTMGVTLQHLCATIKHVSNRTAADVIAQTIITDGKAQLKITTLSLKEIAQNLGFEDAATFNRFFKSQLGITPKVYRNKEA